MIDGGNMNANAVFQFTPAIKSQSKLRAGLFGPAGSGKTFSALRIARGLGGRIAVIDTERGSSCKYADRFSFDVLSLSDKKIQAYQSAINAAAAAGYDVLIIDSLSHGWHELLAEIDRLASTKYRGNSWGAWSEGTPRQRSLIDSILSFPGHVIATMRSRTEWTVESDSNGRQRPVRVGLSPEQGKGIEYEFDILLEINSNHIAQVIKDRSGQFQDLTIDKPGEDFGHELAQWLLEPQIAANRIDAIGQQSAQTVPPQSVSCGNAPHGQFGGCRPRSERGAQTTPTNPNVIGETPRLVTDAQHRRLESLMHGAGVPRERVRKWLAGRHPDAYPDGIHFDRLWEAHANEIERKLPEFVAKMAAEEKSAKSMSPNDNAISETLDWIKSEYDWNGSAEQLADISADVSKRAKTANMRAMARDGNIDQAEVLRAETLARRAKLLRECIRNNRVNDRAIA
jgi:hypothetical protein